MKVKCEQMFGSQLQPGDLFSTAGPDYWDQLDERGSIGERVYIRTNTPADVAVQGDAVVFRITIEKGD